MSKGSFIYLVLVNTTSISCFFKFLYSFFVFSKAFTSTEVNTGFCKYISGMNLSPKKTSLLFHPFYTFKTKEDGQGVKMSFFFIYRSNHSFMIYLETFCITMKLEDKFIIFSRHFSKHFY